MCYQPLLDKPIICFKGGSWRVTLSGHDDLDLAACVFVYDLNHPRLNALH